MLSYYLHENNNISKHLQKRSFIWKFKMPYFYFGMCFKSYGDRIKKTRIYHSVRTKYIIKKINVLKWIIEVLYTEIKRKKEYLFSFWPARIINFFIDQSARPEWLKNVQNNHKYYMDKEMFNDCDYKKFILITTFMNKHFL